MKYRALKTVTGLFLFSLITLSAYAGEHILQPKLGFVDWTDNGTHSVKGERFNLDGSASGSGGFQYVFRLDNGWAFGGELFGYTKDYTHTNGGTGEAEIGHIYGLAEYYFNNEGSFKPFVGVGLGSVGMEFSGEINHETSGGSLQLKGGMEFGISDRFAITAEAKYFTVDIDEEINNQKADIKSNGYGLFAGFTIKI